MAGMYADGDRPLREHLIDLSFEFLREILELRAKTGLQALPRPDELASEGSEAGAAALLAFEQRHLEECRPPLDQIPGVPIREISPICGVRDLARYADLIQQVEHDERRRAVVFAFEAPHGLDFNADHMTFSALNRK